MKGVLVLIMFPLKGPPVTWWAGKWAPSNPNHQEGRRGLKQVPKNEARSPLCLAFTENQKKIFVVWIVWFKILFGEQRMLELFVSLAAKLLFVVQRLELYAGLGLAGSLPTKKQLKHFKRGWDCALWRIKGKQRLRVAHPAQRSNVAPGKENCSSVGGAD